LFAAFIIGLLFESIRFEAPRRSFVSQEQFAMQLIMQLIDIWNEAGLMTSTLSPYRLGFSA
jgi:hypothetical protein